MPCVLTSNFKLSNSVAHDQLAGIVPQPRNKGVFNWIACFLLLWAALIFANSAHAQAVFSSLQATGGTIVPPATTFNAGIRGYVKASQSGDSIFEVDLYQEGKTTPLAGQHYLVTYQNETPINTQRSFDLSAALPAGTYRLFVRATSENALTGDSQVFTVTVAPSPTSAPAAPSPTVTTAAINAVFSILFDDDATAPTTPPSGGTGGTGGTGGGTGGTGDAGGTGGTASIISLDPANPVPIAVSPPHLANADAGTLPGSLSVSASGQATYSMPIAVPPGTAGMAPQLSLNYTSEGSNGPLGLGWSFGGLSTIHRCGKTIAQDQMNGRVSFDKSDRLCLDGQRLVLVNLPASDDNYWATTAEYRTELESFSRIRTVMSGGKRSFEVQTKDGRIMIYGSGSGYALPVVGPVNSGAFADPIGSKAEARLWALDQVRDRVGNYINYGYDQDMSTGEHRLATIRYGGNGLSPHAAVRINYDGRKDAWKRFVDETRNDLRSRVSSVVTYFGEDLSGDVTAGTQARKYTLGYEYSPTSGRSMLASVQVCARNPQTSVCEALTPTRFDWGKPDSSVQPGFTKIGNWANGPILTTNNPFAENKTAIISASNHAEYFSFTDFGGDGLVDVLEKRVSGPMPSDYGSANQYQRDLNNPIAPGTLRTQYNYFHNTGNTGSGFARYTYNIVAEGRNLPFAVLEVADFNGDGAPDLLVSTRDGSVDKPRICLSPLAHGGGLPAPGGMISFICNNQPAVGSNRDVDLPYSVDIKGDGRSGHYGPYNPGTGTAQLCVGDSYVTDANPPSLVLTRMLWEEQIPSQPMRDYVSFSQMIDFAGIGRPADVRWSQPYLWHFVDTDGTSSNIYEWINPDPEIIMTDFRMPGSPDPLGRMRSYSYPLSPSLCTDSLSCMPYYFDAPGSGSVSANFNGDGYSNVVFGFYGVDSSGHKFKKPEFTLCLSTGRALDCSVRAKYSGDNYVSPVTVGDFVGDGMPGILANKVTFTTNGNPIKSGSLQMCRLQGDDNGGVSDTNMVCEPWGGFTYPYTGDAALRDQIFFLDLMGTGRPQLVQYKAGKFVSGVWQENGAWEVYAAVDRAKPTEALDRLVRVTDGLGANSSVEYADGIASGIVSLGDKKLDYPNVVSRSTGKVVARLRRANGVAADRTTAYTYSDSGLNLNGRGALGFAAMASTDEQTGIKITSKYLQTWPYTGMLESQTVSSAAGVVLSESTSVAARRDVAQAFGATTFAYTASSKTVRHDLDGSPLGIADTVNTYGDNFGNLTNQSVTSYLSDGAPKYIAFTETQYKNDPSAWLLGLPEQIKATRTDPVTGTLTRTVSKGYDPATGLLNWETSEPGAPKYSVTNTFSRAANPFGLVNVVTESWLNPDPADPTNKSRSTTTTFDAKGRFVATVTNAKQHKEEHLYDPATGVRVRLIGPNGLSTIWEVNGFGNVTRELRADDNETRTYLKSCDTTCPAGAAAVQIVDHLRGGVRIAVPAVAYTDAAGHILRAMTWGFDGRAIVSDRRYDPLGRLWEEDQPRFSSGSAYLGARHSYDALGREVKLTTLNPSGGEQNATTEYFGVTRRMTNAAGRQRLDKYNVIGKVVAAVDPRNNETHYDYDPFGGLTKTTDSAGNVIGVDYDLLGRRTGLHDPDLGWISYDVDPLGRTWGTTTPKSRATGRQSRVVFDELDRMVARYETDLESHWVYDTATNGIGQLAEAYTGTPTKKDYRRIHAYDEKGRPIQSTQWIGSGSFVAGTVFDAWGRLAQQTYSSSFGQNKAFDYRYNQFGGMARIDRSGLPLIEMTEVDAAVRTRQAKLGNGLQVKKQFNVFTGSLEDGQLNTASGVLRLHEGYQYDALQNVTKRTQYWDVDGFQEDFTYDALNRLETSAVMGQAKQTFVYNEIGNIINKPNVSAGNFEYPTSGPGAVRPHAVTNIPNVGRFAYDDNGNMESAPGRGAEWTSFDMPRVLSKGTASSTFAFGPEHQRTRQDQQPGGSTLLYTAAQEVTQVNGTTTVKTFWPAGLGFEIDKTGATTSLNWIHTDRLGSLVAISDSSGNLVEKLAYDAWGKRRTLDGSATPDSLDGLKDNRGYTGHEMLDQLDLVHMNGRVYDPLIGRFLSGDPLVQDPFNSQSYNRYSYVLNNPTNLVDPTGFAPSEDEEKAKKRQKIIRDACSSSADELRCRSDAAAKIDGLLAEHPDAQLLGFSEGLILAKIPLAKNGGVSTTDLASATDSASANNLVASGVNEARNFADGGYGELTGQAVHNGNYGYAAVYTVAGAIYSFGNLITLGEEGAIIASGRSLGNKAVAEGEQVLANLNPCKCFVAGTPVHTRDGLKPIEEIKVGDLVATRSDVDGHTTWKPVLSLIRYGEKEFVRLTYGDSEGTESLVVTPEHPFMLEGNQWRQAGDLKPGDRVLRLEGDAVTVKSVTGLSGKLATYNFEVADYHTYFVGAKGVWVHNACDLSKLPEQVHHFASNKSKKYTEALAKIADKYGLNLDGAWNKELLRHQGRHPNAYHEFVLDSMKKIDKAAAGSQQKFLDLFNTYVKEPIRNAPEMLRKEWWK